MYVSQDVGGGKSWSYLCGFRNFSLQLAAWLCRCPSQIRSEEETQTILTKLRPALFSLDLYLYMRLQSLSGLMQDGAYDTIHRIVRTAAYHALYRHANDTEDDNFYQEREIQSIIRFARHPEAIRPAGFSLLTAFFDWYRPFLDHTFVLQHEVRRLYDLLSESMDRCRGIAETVARLRRISASLEAFAAVSLPPQTAGALVTLQFEDEYCLRFMSSRALRIRPDDPIATLLYPCHDFHRSICVLMRSIWEDFQRLWRGERTQYRYVVNGWPCEASDSVQTCGVDTANTRHVSFAILPPVGDDIRQRIQIWTYYWLPTANQRGIAR